MVWHWPAGWSSGDRRRLHRGECVLRVRKRISREPSDPAPLVIVTSGTEAQHSAYLRTEVSIVLPEARWVNAGEAIRLLGVRVHVLTAWNPGEERPGAPMNRERNRRLRERLDDVDADRVFPAIGASPDGHHFEESFAVTGLDRPTALALGREFGQVAIFELTQTDQIVVGCDGDWELSRSHVPA